MRVLVCGGRGYSDAERLIAVLDTRHRAEPITLLIHGGARGADELAGEWARAQRRKYGRAAGPSTISEC